MCSGLVKFLQTMMPLVLTSQCESNVVDHWLQEKNHLEKIWPSSKWCSGFEWRKGHAGGEGTAETWGEWGRMGETEWWSNAIILIYDFGMR